MSTYWRYRFRAPLKSGVVFEELRKLASKEDIYFDLETNIEEYQAAQPCFGPDTECEWENDTDFQGMAILNGELTIAVFASNLERNDAEDIDGISFEPEKTRLMFLFEFLSKITTGTPGDVVGSIASEHTDGPHGHPLIRCADGIIRAAITPPDDDHDYKIQGPVALIPAKIPLEFLSKYDTGWVDLDWEGLRARYMPIEGSLAYLTIGHQ